MSLNAIEERGTRTCVPASLANISVSLGMSFLLATTASAQTQRVSVRNGGVQVSGGQMHHPSLSLDGCSMAFESNSGGIVSDDTNGSPDVFVNERCGLQPTRTILVSTSGTGTLGNGPSGAPAMSGDGHFVAFSSDATNLVPNDTNGRADVFVKNVRTGAISRVSVGVGGGQANEVSGDPAIGVDGRFVAFTSVASNLVPDDTNGLTDTFVHDRQTGHTTRVSVSGAGAQGNGSSAMPSISGDGRYVAFASGAKNLVTNDTNNATDVFVRDLLAGTTSRVSVRSDGAEGLVGSLRPTMSTDGRVVAFHSTAPLVVNDTNTTADVFVHVMTTGQTSRASVSSGGAQSLGASPVRPVLSYDGRFVGFVSSASDLVPLDTNQLADVFVHDRITLSTVRVHLDVMGDQVTSGSPDAVTMAGSGHVVGFASDASTLVAGDTNAVSDIFVHQWPQFRRTRVDVGAGGVPANAFSREMSLSGDGRYVAFHSAATNLVANDTNGDADIFVRDRGTSATTRVSVATGGEQANGGSFPNLAIDADGRDVAFCLSASNLVPGDTNNTVDVFVHDRTSGATTRASVSSQGAQGNGASCTAGGLSMSADGRYVAFFSDATNLVPNDTNGGIDAFVHDRATGNTVRASLTDRDAQVSDLGGVNQAFLSLHLSADGRSLAFTAVARMVTGQTDTTYSVFVRDLVARQTTRESGAFGGAAPNDASHTPSMSYDGRSVAFASIASNLVPGDTNGQNDVFVRNRRDLTTTRLSLTDLGTQAAGDSSRPSLSPDGRYVVFPSTAENLGPPDTNGRTDVFVRDLITGRVSLVSRTLEGLQSLNHARHAAMSADHRVIGYEFNIPGNPDPSNELIVRATTPTINGLWPRAGGAAGGTSLQIWGEGFAPGTRVSFNGRPATGIDPYDPNDIQVTVPPGTPGEIATMMVTVPGYEPVSMLFAYTYVDTPPSSTTDSDGDTIPDVAELQYSLDPLDELDGSLDCDDDGATNTQEIRASTHPCGVRRALFAEGVTSDFFTTEFALTNTYNRQATVLASFQTSTGATIRHFLVIPARSRRTLDPATIPGLERAEFSTVFESSWDVSVSRLVKWGDGYGSHEEAATFAPRALWYLAEGATHSGFDLFYLLQNPQSTPVTVTVKFVRPAPALPIDRVYTLAPRSRFTIWVDRVAPQLEHSDVSAEIVASAPILVERSMYLSGQGRTFNAGHASAGIPAQRTKWFFAEGATGSFFDLFILLANFKTFNVDATVTYLLPDGTSFQKVYVVPPLSRYNIWVDLEDARLADTAVSVRIDVPIGQEGIVAERAMWWPGPTGATWHEAHASAGSPYPFYFAEVAGGEQGGPTNAETYILVANVDPIPGRARVTLFFEDRSSVTKEFAVLPTSRFNVSVGAEFPEALGKRFGARVESIGLGAANFVVEQALYSDAGGVRWAAGANMLAQIPD